jgi:hypothetical protein
MFPPRIERRMKTKGDRKQPSAMWRRLLHPTLHPIAICVIERKYFWFGRRFFSRRCKAGQVGIAIGFGIATGNRNRDPLLNICSRNEKPNSDRDSRYR